MEFVSSSFNASFSLRCSHNTPFLPFSIPQIDDQREHHQYFDLSDEYNSIVFLCHSASVFSLRVIESRFPLAHRRKKGVGSTNRDYGKEFSIGVVPRISSIFYPKNIRQHASGLFVRWLVPGVILVMSVSCF
ncbi:hypothetical protein VNO78_20014 [Psophocarpus tetragonolobus]|uniref:Uncharacterized protein n=1 Tax=Psophocarpus tetragonolobus TaxID=3891 RepID=A0AAN9XGC9_PSOTE